MFFSLRIRFLLLALLVLPQLGRAQATSDGGFQAGSYVLRDVPGFRQQGQLKLQSSTRLVVKHADDKPLKFSPDQVASFRIGSQRYVTAGGFHVIGGLGGATVDLAFAEQLDSGQVVLLRYAYSIGAPMSMNAGGGMTYSGASSMTTYVLSRSSIPGFAAAQAGAYSSGGKKFRENVRPYFEGRPDLQKLVDDKRITANNLPEAVRAFNTNSPYFPPR